MIRGGQATHGLLPNRDTGAWSRKPIGWAGMGIVSVDGVRAGDPLCLLHMVLTSMLQISISSLDFFLLPPNCFTKITSLFQTKLTFSLESIHLPLLPLLGHSAI